jgi:uncharacterized membrane protein YphA (DoxX/SURF4 family)
MIRTQIDMWAATIARLLVGGYFAISGANNLIDLPSAVNIASQAGLPASTLMVIVASFTKMFFGVLIVMKFHTKLASLMLIIYVILTTLIFYSPFVWNQNPSAEIIFVKNLAILSGLLCLYANSRGVTMLQSGELARLENQNQSKLQ